MSARKPPTMRDVARLAGVAAMTVSRALRDSELVSASTRARVLEAAEQLGYTVDGQAAALSSRHTGFVAAIVPSLNNANFADTVRGLTEVLREHNFQLLIGYTDYSLEEEERVVELMLRRRPEAIVLTGGSHTERCCALLSNAGLPIVETWDLPANPLGHVVGFSNEGALDRMTEELFIAGFRQIAFVGSDMMLDPRGLKRRKGYERGLERLGLHGPRVVSTGPVPVTIARGATALETILTRWPETDAVLCVSDIAAFGVMSEALRRGIDVPGDLGIAGFGAFDVAETCHPRMTTIDVGAKDIGRCAGEIVVAACAQPDGFSRRIVEMPVRPLLRESTRRESLTPRRETQDPRLPVPGRERAES